MKPVICFGEALIDFLMFNVTPQEKLKLPEFRQYPGGAPANAAVAIAKLGGKAKFAGQVGRDSFGQFLAEALLSYGVDTRFLERHPTAKTALAFVSLDQHGERSFSFHRDGTADVIFTNEQVKNEWFDDQAIFHFCSNTLTTTAIAKCTEHAVQQAQHHKSLISFDVNLRHNLWSSGHADTERVNKLVYQANVVKFAREEFDYLANGNTANYLKTCFEAQCQAIIITDGDKQMDYYTPRSSGHVVPPKVNTVDTTAGGDAFIGGLLCLLSCIENPAEVFESTEQLNTLLQFASYCGACAVTEQGAFPALPSLSRVKSLYAENNLDISQIEQWLL